MYCSTTYVETRLIKGMNGLAIIITQTQAITLRLRYAVTIESTLALRAYDYQQFSKENLLVPEERSLLESMTQQLAFENHSDKLLPKLR